MTFRGYTLIAVSMLYNLEKTNLDHVVEQVAESRILMVVQDWRVVTGVFVHASKSLYTLTSDLWWWWVFNNFFCINLGNDKINYWKIHFLL